MTESVPLQLDWAPAYARLLCEYCLRLKKGDRLLVRSTYLAEPLLQALSVVATQLGALVTFQIEFRDQERLFLSHAAEAQLAYPDPLYDMAVSEFDALLTIRAPFDRRSLSGVSPSVKSLRQAAMAPIKQRFMDRSASGALKWCLCNYPVNSLASDAGMSLEDYALFIKKACFLDTPDPVSAWATLSGFQQRIVDYLNKADRIVFQGPNIDLSFSTRGRLWQNSDGKRNMPSGEVFTSPVEDSLNGWVYFTYPSRHQGEDVEDVHFEIQNGVVTNWSAKVGQSVLDSVLKLDGANRFGEVAIGTNYTIQKATKDTLFDEKIGGSVHLAIGASYPETGGKNTSAIHWDLITDMKNGGKILVDGTCIYQDGQFLFFH